MNQQLDHILEEILDKDPRYKRDAYEFVLDSLSYTQKRLKRHRHVNGVELLEGIKELLLKEFGPMALAVLHHWGIKSTDDFGHIVFHLVENRVLSKTPDDALEHFQNRYDFHEVFDKGYRKQLEKRIRRMRSAW